MYLSRPPPHPTPLVEALANALSETGSFFSPQRSLEFVQTMASEGIESVIQLALRLEHAFMVEVTSSDMSLLLEAPGTVFDGTRMTNEDSIPKGRDRIAGTMEVGVLKKTCGGPGEVGRAEILLKTKVVLEKDLVED